MTLNKNSTALSIASQTAEHNKQPQHCRITIADAIALYKARDITAKGLLRLYFKIHIAPGWKIRKAPAEIYNELGINRTTFADALNKLKAEGVIECQTLPYSTRLEIRLISTDSDNLSTIPTTCRETVTGVVDSDTGEVKTVTGEVKTVTGDGTDTKKPSKPLPAKDSTNASYSSSDSFQIFLNSLSEEARERFLNFSRKKAEELPRQPALVDQWIAKHFEDLSRQWEKVEGKSPSSTPASSKMENHPRREEWLAEIANLRDWHKFTSLATNHPELVERGKFYDWVEDTNLIPGLKVVLTRGLAS